jgi:hypothetical protein
VASLLSSVRFASLLTYSPRGTSRVSVSSRKVRDFIKSGQRPTLERAIQRVRERWEEAGFEEFLGPGVVLVPVPRSSPLRDTDALWPAERICRSLEASGAGGQIMRCLERTEAVPKSAFAAPRERPSAERHFRTLAVHARLPSPERITVVDDVVTKGATLLAAASRLAEAFPDAEVRAFALLRTMGLVEDVERILDPCTGILAWNGEDVSREP